MAPLHHRDVLNVKDVSRWCRGAIYKPVRPNIYKTTLSEHATTHSGNYSTILAHPHASRLFPNGHLRRHRYDNAHPGRGRANKARAVLLDQECECGKQKEPLQSDPCSRIERQRTGVAAASA